MRLSPRFEVISLAEVPRDIPDVQSKKHWQSILVVDDEKVIADTLSIILSKSGYVVRTAYNGRVALEMIKDAPPQLLITDVVMPGITGIELATTVAETVPDCKILLFSGQSVTRDLLQKARDHGHNFFIMAKPVHPMDMLNQVRECLNQKEMVAESA